MPRIGAGQAGGDWRIIREMLDQILVLNGVEVNVYIPPGTALEPDAERQLSLSIAST
jgi:hypothetical protein